MQEDPQTKIPEKYQACTLHLYTAHGLHTAHRDYVTIPGAKIVHLHKAFMSEYGTVTIGMDIVLVAGLNDVARGHTRNYIMQCITDLRRAVTQQAEDYHPEAKNTRYILQ